MAKAWMIVDRFCWSQLEKYCVAFRDNFGYSLTFSYVTYYHNHNVFQLANTNFYQANCHMKSWCLQNFTVIRALKRQKVCASLSCFFSWNDAPYAWICTNSVHNTVFFKKFYLHENTSSVVSLHATYCKNTKFSYATNFHNHIFSWFLNTVIAEIFVRVKNLYSSVCRLSYARNFRTATVVSDTLVYVYGFRMLLNFVLSAKSTKYTKLNRVRKFVRLQYQFQWIATCHRSKYVCSKD